MNGLLISIAVRHLLARRRQSIVSLFGIVLGVAFFLAISSMMQGTEDDFMRRLIDNAPHITIDDEFRNPHPQPAQEAFAHGAVEIARVKPETETRGIRGYKQILQYLSKVPALTAAGSLTGQALVTFAGQDVAIGLNGMNPEDIPKVTTIASYMIAGSLDSLSTNQSAIIIGDQLARKLSLGLGENLTVAAATGQVRTFKVMGLFHTGRSNYDNGQAFVNLKRLQSLLNRPNRANTIIVKLADANDARRVAADIEARIGYKAVSWQEASEDLMSALWLRKVVMYSVVSAVLIVAAFGIYNIISTVVMEKQRDIAILKSMGFRAADVLRIFLIQGVVLGIAGSAVGLPFGTVLILALGSLTFKLPGSSDPISMAMSWSPIQFALAAGFAVISAMLAAYIPARKAARVQPVDILRGGT